MDTLHEQRFGGRLGSPALLIRALDRALNNAAGKAHVQRVELRYSGHAPAPLDAAAVDRAMKALLCEHGLGLAQVSTRRHAAALEDASGEHTLRLMGQPLPPAPQASPWWRQLWARWRPGRTILEAAAPANPTQRSPGEARLPKAPSAPEVPAAPPAQAVALLRRAVHRAVLVGRPDSALEPVTLASARVITRAAPLHRTLQTLVTADPATVGAMVRATGCRTADGWRVAYAYEPRQDGDGTALAGMDDLEVELTEAASLPGPATEDDTTALPDADPSQRSPVATTDATALPAFGPETPRPLARLRVLGSRQSDFDEPFEITISQWPARIDRQWMAARGFGRRHGPLLSVFSNRQALWVDCRHDGECFVSFVGPDGNGPSGPPMYRDARSLAPLAGRHALNDLPEELLVNDPKGCRLPGHPAVLPALRLSLRMDASE